MLTATISHKKHLTPTTLLVRLSLTEELTFHAGQHIILNIPADGELIERPFSIASSPEDNRHIDIVVRLVNGGVASTFLKECHVGAKLQFTGPKGTFDVQPGIKPVTLIASGSGIAPFRSMISGLLKGGKTRRVTLFFVVSAQKELFFEKELKVLSQTHTNFTYVPVVSNPHHLSYFRKAEMDTEADFYLCGGFHFVNDITKLLKKKGVEKKRVHFEEFK